MRLDLAERLTLLNVLPPEGDILTLRIVQQLRTDLSFSEDEVASAEIVRDGDQVRWNPEADISKDVEMGDAAKGLIVAALKQLNEAGKLTVNHISLYERFVEAP